MEGKRYLRYALPGLVFLFEFGFFLVIIFWKEIEIPKDKTGITAGLGLLTLFGSGPIGYLLSIVHHRFIGRNQDYFDIVKWATEKTEKKVILKFFEKGKMVSKKVEDLDRKEGVWRIHNAIWNQVLVDNEKHEKFVERADDLADLFHGLGATFIGAVVAGIVWFGFCDWAFLNWLFCGSTFPLIEALGAAAFVAGLLWIHWETVAFVQRQFVAVVGEGLFHALNQRRDDETVLVWVGAKDLKRTK